MNSRLHFIQKLFANDAAYAAEQPLLDEVRISQLLLAVESINLTALNRLVSRSAYRGEQQSRAVGRGIEFEELRAYQSGDEVRDIDWKVTLRTSTPYIRVKREERRACVQLLLDRRATMRFATQGKLKITQAVEVALQLLVAAKRLQMDVQVSCIDSDRIQVLKPASTNWLGQVLDELIAPCPPLYNDSRPAEWQNVLEYAEQRVADSSWFVMLGDFHAITTAQLPSLSLLAGQSHTLAVQVSDPVEEQLPSLGRINLVSPWGETRGELDSNNKQVKASFIHQQQQRQKDLDVLFRQAGIEHWHIRTTDDALKIFHAMVQHGPG